jgi:hypothetical protein
VHELKIHASLTMISDASLKVVAYLTDIDVCWTFSVILFLVKNMMFRKLPLLPLGRNSGGSNRVNSKPAGGEVVLL